MCPDDRLHHADERYGDLSTTRQIPAFSLCLGNFSDVERVNGLLLQWYHEPALAACEDLLPNL
jgi:hypothetical protein